MTKFCDEHIQEVAGAAGKRKRGTTSRVCQQCQALKAKLVQAQADVARLQSKLDARDAATAGLSEQVYIYIERETERERERESERGRESGRDGDRMRQKGESE